MSQRIPLSAVPSQTLSITLDGQAAQITLRQNQANMYLDLQLGDEFILRTKVCRDRQQMLTGSEYLGFRGGLMFVDMLGNQQPFYLGLDSRYVLLYFTADELATL